MAKAPLNPITEADRAAFHQYMLKWQGLLNLNDWRVESAAKPASRGTMAEVHIDDEARLATYRVGESFGGAPVTPESLEATALHELLHVRLRDALVAASTRPNNMDGVEHALINPLEKLLMDAYADKEPEAA